MTKRQKGFIPPPVFFYYVRFVFFREDETSLDPVSLTVVPCPSTLAELKPVFDGSPLRFPITAPPSIAFLIY
jgi:hypothetical protein